jgi:hypothetical protein
MIECADAAMRNAQFGYSGQTKRISYFLVNEAEAGALHTLQSKAHVFKVCLFNLLVSTTTECCR